MRSIATAQVPILCLSNQIQLQLEKAHDEMPEKYRFRFTLAGMTFLLVPLIDPSDRALAEYCYTSIMTMSGIYFVSCKS